MLPKIIALTGGIGSGKSTVANLFVELGVPVIDADVISRELTKSDTEITQKIIEYFGKDYLINNKLDREKLRNQIFASKTDKKFLENLLHPAIYAIIQKQITKLKWPYIIIAIPLLIETGIPDFIDKVLVVDSPEELQIKRVAERDDLSQQQIKKIINSQATRKQRLEKADDVIINNNDIESLRKQVLVLDRKYKN